jgi:hypothetical protein
LSDWRPIRPKPLMPTRTAMTCSFATLRSPTGGERHLLSRWASTLALGRPATRSTAERMVAS